MAIVLERGAFRMRAINGCLQGICMGYANYIDALASI